MKKMMQAAVYYNNQDIRIEEHPIPDIGPGEVLIKTAACGLCGSESMEWYQIKHAPKIMGHEASGTIEAVGEGVTGFKEGDRVFVNHHIGRIHSHTALRGHFTCDPYYKQKNLNPGTMCQYFSASAEHVLTDTHIIPDHVPFGAATVIEPWGCVIGGLKTAGIQPGDTVAVVGCGFMGQGFVHMAPLFGSGKVFALDFSDYRLGKAQHMGATHSINPRKEDPDTKLKDLNQGRLADVVITTVPNTKALDQALSLIGPGGTLHINAPPAPDQNWQISPYDLYMKEVTTTNKYSADHNDIYSALRWLDAGRIDPEPVITHRFELDGTPEAFELLVKADKSIKSVIYANGLLGE
ncbi:MAG: alcohol dehydrogenase catalytic domain-containing protein [Deltaproteobacteria bacterium]|jgi:L-iditol 2-dehydrogenase|nr:alcohol dehydrogenase catalytic domain-containing protein [Deltaproteobacteria bacterium]